jgi:hypothetical protein
VNLKNNFKDLIYSVIFIGLKDYKIITYTNSTCIIDINNIRFTITYKKYNNHVIYKIVPKSKLKFENTY